MDVTKSCTTRLPSVVGLMSCDDDSFWIHNSQEKKLQKVKIQDDVILLNEINDIKVYDCSRWSSDHGFMLSIYSDHRVLTLTKEGHLKTLTSIFPLLPLGIHATSNNEILVGFQENAATFPITEKSRRGIIILGFDKKTKVQYDLDTKQRRLFTCPYRVTTNINKDICVCDILTSDNFGRVVTLGQDGLVKWSYIGHPVINNGWNKFNPEGIVTTSCGNIVITDCNNHAIHVLSLEGELILCQLTQELNFIAPCSVDIDKMDNLKIGCAAEKGDNDARIVLVKFKEYNTDL